MLQYDQKGGGASWEIKQIDPSDILNAKQLSALVAEVNELKEDGFCFILGAGASVESGIPTGNELERRWMDCLMGEKDDIYTKKKDPNETRDLARQLWAEGTEDSKKLFHPFEEIEAAWRTAKETNTSIPSKYYSDLYRLRFHPDFKRGHRYLEQVMAGKEPSIGYHALAMILTKLEKSNLVITTNFDSLVEDVLFLYGDKRPMVAGHESLAPFIDLNRTLPTVAKIHRSLYYEPVNTPDARLPREWIDLLNDAFNRYIPIIIGYGGGDQSLMAYLTDDHTTFRRGFYWCYVGDKHPDGEIEQLVLEKGGHFVSIKGFDAIMLELGWVLFGDDALTPTTVSALLQQQTDTRIGTYTSRWSKLNRERPELKEEVAPMREAEKAEAAKREEANELTAWDYFNRAYDAYEAGDLEKAIADYSKAIARKPDYAFAYNNRGLAYDNLGKYDEAFADYNKAIELNPDHANAYNNRGFVYAEQRAFEKALEDIENALKLKPEHPNFLHSLGFTYMKRGEEGDREKALELFTKVISLDDSLIDPYEDRAKIYREMGEIALAEQDEAKVEELRQKQKPTNP